MELLRRNAAFRRLWLARVVSVLGDSLGVVALILYVAGETGRATAVGLLLLAADLTPTLVSPVVGVVADRLQARRAMVACELGQAVAVGAIVAFTPPLAALLTLVAARSLLGAVFQAVSRASLADLVDDADLERANSLLGAGTYGLDALGPLLAAAVLPFLSRRGVLAVDGLTFVAAAWLLTRLPALPPAAGPETAGARAGVPRRAAADARAGLAHIRRDRLLFAVTTGFFAVVAFNGVDDVALVFLGADTFAAGDPGTSLLYAGSGVGLLAGFAALARRRPLRLARDPAAAVVTGFAVSSAGNLLTGLSPVLGAALAMQVVRGAGISVIEVGTNTLIQRSVPREVRGRVFANLYGAVGLAAGVSYAAGGPLLEVLSAPTVLVGAGAGGLLASTAVALALHRQHRGRVSG